MDVPIRCVCPPKADGSPRHEGDTITLRDTLGFREVTAIRHGVSLLDNGDPFFPAEVLALLTESYVIYGVESWSLVDEKGKALPLTREALRERILTLVDVAQQLGDAADELYGEKVLLPLLARASTRSQGTPTDGSTSPTTDSSPKRPRPLKRSSIGSSRTADTGTTSSSPDGDSNSLPSSASAA